MSLTLDTLIDAAKGENPTEAMAKLFNEQGATRADIEALRSEAADRFTEIRSGDSVGTDEMAALTILAEVSDAATAELGKIDAAEAEMQAQLDELDARMVPEADSTPNDGDAPTGDADAEATADTVEAATPEPAAAAAVAPQTPATDDEEDDEDKKKEQAVEPLVAAGRVRLSHLQKQAPTPEPTPDAPKSRTTIVAAADVRGFATGQELSGIDQITEAAVAKMSQMPRGAIGKDTRIQAGVASIKRDYPLKANMDNNDQAIIEKAADQSRLDGGSLVASGGWGATSEVSYELSPNLSSPNAGLISLPTIGAPRGGIRFMATPDYATVAATGKVANIRTEEDEADTPYVEKPVYRIPGTTWEDVRLDVVPTIVEAGILQANALPELNRRHVELVMAVHEHEINESSIKRMVSASTAVSAAAFGPSATTSLLNAIGLLIKHIAYRYRAQPNLGAEVVLPEYIREVVRADYALRSGVPLENVSDAMIDGWFASRNASVQWVYDYQDAYTGLTGNGVLGGATAPTQYPATVEALVYPTGTFVRARSEIVNLDAIYDSTNVKSNDFLQLMVEESLFVHQRAYESFKLTVPLGVNGATGAPVALDGNGKVVVPDTDNG